MGLGSRVSFLRSSLEVMGVSLLFFLIVCLVGIFHLLSLAVVEGVVAAVVGKRGCASRLHHRPFSHLHALLGWRSNMSGS